MDDEIDPRRWVCGNLVGVAADVIGNAAFNRHPVELAIAGCAAAHRGLFALLDACPEPAECAAVFAHYMDLAFALHDDPPPAATPRRHAPASYAALLAGWGMDSNGPAGAVLKGWVESRFGLVPVFHGEPLRRFPSPAWIRYLEQKSGHRLHNHSILQQLDLLYTFCQWWLRRFVPGGGAALMLWRGSNRCDEQLVDPAPRGGVMRLNNLVSFSLDADRADCFGDCVFSAHVPRQKIVHYPGMLARAVLQGEREVLAIGGDFAVEYANV